MSTPHSSFSLQDSSTSNRSCHSHGSMDWQQVDERFHRIFRLPLGALRSLPASLDPASVIVCNYIHQYCPPRDHRIDDILCWSSVVITPQLLSSPNLLEARNLTQHTRIAHGSSDSLDTALAATSPHESTGGGKYALNHNLPC